jgi:hypothetical protein
MPSGVTRSRAKEGRPMLIVDAQVHIWSSGKPANSNHRQVPVFSKDLLPR